MLTEMEQQVIIVVSEVEQEVIIKNKTITAVTNEQNFTATRWFACSKTIKKTSELGHYPSAYLNSTYTQNCFSLNQLYVR